LSEYKLSSSQEQGILHFPHPVSFALKRWLILDTNTQTVHLLQDDKPLSQQKIELETDSIKFDTILAINPATYFLGNQEGHLLRKNNISGQLKWLSHAQSRPLLNEVSELKASGSTLFVLDRASQKVRIFSSKGSWLGDVPTKASSILPLSHAEFLGIEERGEISIITKFSVLAPSSLWFEFEKGKVEEKLNLKFVCMSPKNDVYFEAQYDAESGVRKVAILRLDPIAENLRKVVYPMTNTEFYEMDHFFVCDQDSEVRKISYKKSDEDEVLSYEKVDWSQAKSHQKPKAQN